MTKILSVLILSFAVIFLAGCAPHFYKREMMVIETNNTELKVIDSAPIQDCIFETTTPINYALVSENYSIKIMAISGFAEYQSKFLIQAQGNQKEILKITGDGIKETPAHYKSDLSHVFERSSKKENAMGINILGENGELLGSEKFNFTISQCQAMAIDAI